MSKYIDYYLRSNDKFNSILKLKENISEGLISFPKKEEKESNPEIIKLARLHNIEIVPSIIMKCFSNDLNLELLVLRPGSKENSVFENISDKYVEFILSVISELEIPLGPSKIIKNRDISITDITLEILAEEIYKSRRVQSLHQALTLVDKFKYEEPILSFDKIMNSLNKEKTYILHPSTDIISIDLSKVNGIVYNNKTNKKLIEYIKNKNLKCIYGSKERI